MFTVLFVGFLIVIVLTGIFYVAVAIFGSEDDNEQLSYGYRNPSMHCPHCNTVGQVRTKRIQQKKGISGGKATAAVLTGGVSVIATGLSRKEATTQAFCSNCKNLWTF